MRVDQVVTAPLRHESAETAHTPALPMVRLKTASAVVGVAVLMAIAVHTAPVVALVPVAVVAGLWVIARPDLAGTVAAGLLYSNAIVVATRSHGAPGALAALVPLLLLITISYRVFACREPFLLPRPGLWVVALVVSQMLGAAFSRDPASSVATWQVTLIEGLALFALVTNAIRGFAMIRSAALLLVCIAALLSSFSVLQQVGGIGGTFGGFATKSKAVIGDDTTGVRRLSGPIGEQNRWAQTLAVVLPLAVALGATDRSKTVRVVASISAVAIAAGVTMTYSRGALVGLALTGLVAVCLRWIRLRWAVVGALVSLVALGALAPVFLERASTVTNVSSSVRGSSADQPVDGSIANRTIEANAAISVFLHHPVVGVGVGLFPTYFQDEARRLGADRIVGVNREAHNLYLGIAAESGLAGSIAFGGLAVSILGPLAALRRRQKAERRDVAGLATGFALGFITYLTTGFFLHFAYIRYFWLLAALATVMGMVDQDGPALPTRAGGSR